jgi:hypothetical protein
MKITAQGELTIIHIDLLTQAELRALQKSIGMDLSAGIPADAKLIQKGGDLILGHSESGHHHAVQSPCAELFETSNPLVCFLRSEVPEALEHRKPVSDPHRHATKHLAAGTHMVTRQRETTPLGWRMVQD